MIDLPARVRHWLANDALPFWADTGVDHDAGGFVERLAWDGTPDLDAVKRVRVQARQIYVFAHADHLGLMPGGREIATVGYDFLVRHAMPDGVDNGVVHALARDGTIVDARRDTYDHAFVLFGLSWFYRVTGREDARALVLALGDAIWRLLRHPGGAGFIVDDQGNDALHQNPHMHLFEAVLAAYDATGETIFLDRADELFALFRTRMFDPQTGALREFYDANWRPAAGEAGQLIEPGHHCEWVWLLKWYADRKARPLCDEARQLHAFVERHGRGGHGPLLIDATWSDGRPRSSGTRSWPQTEALKAVIALAQADGVSARPDADRIVANLFLSFLGRPVAGGWIDWIDADGAPMVHMIPASTFYHVFLGLSEYLRVCAA